MREEVEATCKRHRPISDTTEVEKGHGRMETRRCQVFEKGLTVDFEGRRSGLQSVITITSTGEIRDKTTTEERYYISSPDTEQPFNQYIRNHWSVENALHWALDMVFHEEGQRKRNRLAAENFAAVRKIALNLLKKDSSTKACLVSKRLKAARNKIISWIC